MPSPFGLRMAKVVAVHPESHAVDIVYLDNGAQVPNVKVLSVSGSTNAGHVDLPTPTPPSEPYGAVQTKDRDIYAVVGEIQMGTGRGIPVVLGFQFPEVSQLLFEQNDRKIVRHSSDVYTSIDAQGNMEVYHPSGTYLRIGSSSAHEDLTGQDFDKKWKITKNTGAAVHVHLSVANAGSQVASIDIDPSGNVTTQNNGNLSATVGGTTTVTSTGNATLTAPTITLSGNVHITGTLQQDGAVTANSSITATGDVVGQGKSLHGHTHSGVTTGTGTSGPPS